MDIAVTGEGVTDYGKKKFGQDGWEEGTVQVYLNRIAENNGVVKQQLIRYMVRQKKNIV